MEINIINNRCYFEEFAKPPVDAITPKKEDGVELYNPRFTFFGLIPFILKKVGILKGIHYGENNKKVVYIRSSKLLDWINNHLNSRDSRPILKNSQAWEKAVQDICDNYKKREALLKEYKTPGSQTIKPQTPPGMQPSEPINVPNSNWMFAKKPNTWNTALHEAALNGKIDDAEKLIATLPKNFDINSLKNAFGRTPLHLAALRGNVEMVKLLIAHGAKDIADDGENKASDCAIEGNDQILADFIKDKASVAKDTKNIQIPEEPKAPQVVTAQHCAWLNQRDPESGNTPLHKACAKGDLETARKLLKELPETYDINTIKNKYEATALHSAAQQGKTELAKLLIERGAKDIPNAEGKKPSEYAEEFEHKDLANTIKTKAG